MDKIVFYGTRGTSSLSSKKYMEFGGATTCIMLNLGSSHIMVDCGSGIANAIEDLKSLSELHLFVSHSHIDHIGGVPTLLSAFEGKTLHIYGKTFNGISIKESIGRLMNQSLWPVRAETYKNVVFNEIDNEITIDGVKISNMDSNHQGGCSLFRFDYEDDSIVTCFDFCHLGGYEEKLLNFAKGAKTLIYDGTFTEAEFEIKMGWGHSTPEEGARIGKKLNCEKVYITHHGSYDDIELNKWEEKVRKIYPNVTFARSGQKEDDLKKMVDLGTMLSSEKDNDVLLTKIVTAMMELTNADGGTLYLLENNKLEFKVLINKSRNAKLVRKDTPLGINAVDINGKNLCATSAREKKIINIPNCYEEKKYDFSGTFEYDKTSGYHTQSVLALPMIDALDDVVGVIQLINAENKEGKIVPFKKQDEDMLLAISNQASMAIVNSIYSQQINDLLYGFVKVMSVGIDERTPYNANHTRNMVSFAERFLDFENKQDGKYKVDPMKKREILMGIWLHDIGKILTPIDIMNKDSRLGDLINVVNNRFERRALLLQLFLAKGEITKEEYDKLEAERIEQLDFITEINKAGFLANDLKEKLDILATKTYKELDGTLTPVITNEEHHQLSIVKGTLTMEERSIMEGHVTMTQKLLSQLNFPKYYDNIPAYAGNHHEFLNGSGYPNHLDETDLPWPCRLITVCDIYEALTAKDRPYKKPMPVEKAFSILYEMADHKQLDLDIVQEFEKSKAWENE